jgi:hypothetical protein
MFRPMRLKSSEETFPSRRFRIQKPSFAAVLFDAFLEHTSNEIVTSRQERIADSHNE